VVLFSARTAGVQIPGWAGGSLLGLTGGQGANAALCSQSRGLAEAG